MSTGTNPKLMPEPDIGPPANLPSWKRFVARLPHLHKKPKSVRKPKIRKVAKPNPAPKVQDRIEREWQFKEIREPGFPFPISGRQPRSQRVLRFVRGVSYWIRTLLELAFILAFVVVIVWAVGELRVHGYLPVAGWSTWAERFTNWTNTHIGGQN